MSCFELLPGFLGLYIYIYISIRGVGLLNYICITAYITTLPLTLFSRLFSIMQREPNNCLLGCLTLPAVYFYYSWVHIIYYKFEIYIPTTLT